MALGDSYTIGESVAPAERWPVRLAALLRQEGVALDEPQIVATTGWTTGELIAGIDRAAPRGPFDLVSLLIGVNNQYRGLEPGEYRKQISAMLARAIEFAAGQNYGLALALNDDDTPGSAGRQTRVTNRKGQKLDDPTTWSIVVLDSPP